jgi:hypothetical protein
MPLEILIEAMHHVGPKRTLSCRIITIRNKTPYRLAVDIKWQGSHAARTLPTMLKLLRVVHVFLKMMPCRPFTKQSGGNSH